MKKIKFLSMLLLMLVTMFSFAACSDDDDEGAVASSSIVGTWEQINDAGTTITVTFNSNKTGRINFVYSDGSGDRNENFEYDYIEASDGTRHLTIVGSSLAGNYTVTITATRLHLYYSEDYYYYFEKV